MAALKDVARKTGFSISVVSRVLNPHPDKSTRVSEKTRRLIIKTAREMKFRRNRFAEGLKRGKAPIIGVFLPNVANRLIADLVIGISEEADIQDFSLSFCFNRTLISYRNFIKRTSEIRHSGIITYPEFLLAPKIVKEIETYQKEGGNILLLNTTASVKNIPMVSIDNYYGGKCAAECLLRKRCKSFIGVVLKGYPERIQGFVDTVRREKKEVKVIDNDEVEIKKILNLEKSNKNFPIGIFASSDNIALKVMRIARKLSLMIGHEALLIGYDDLFLTDEMNPPLTTIHQPFRDEGRTAVRKIVNMINGKQESSVMIKPSLIIRETA